MPTPLWEKGQSGNPAGRPPGTKNFTTKVREALEKIAEGKDYTYEEAFVRSILKKAIVDGDSGTQKLIWNYLDGMPIQKISGEDGGPLQVNIISYSDKDAINHNTVQLEPGSTSITNSHQSEQTQSNNLAPESSQDDVVSK